MASSKITVSGGGVSQTCHCPDEDCNIECQKVLHGVLDDVFFHRLKNGHKGGKQSGSGTFSIVEQDGAELKVTVEYKGMSKDFEDVVKKSLGGCFAHPTLQACKAP